MSSLTTLAKGDVVVLDVDHRPNQENAKLAAHIKAGNEKLRVREVSLGCGGNYVVVEHKACGNVFAGGDKLHVSRFVYPVGAATPLVGQNSPVSASDRKAVKFKVGDYVERNADEDDDVPNGTVVRVTPGNSYSYDLVYLDSAPTDAYFAYRYHAAVKPEQPKAEPAKPATRRVRLVTSKESIARGNYESPYNCPFAQAVKRAVKKQYHNSVLVVWDYFEVDGKTYKIPNIKDAVTKVGKTFHRYVELPVEILK